MQPRVASTSGESAVPSAAAGSNPTAVDAAANPAASGAAGQLGIGSEASRRTTSQAGRDAAAADEGDADGSSSARPQQPLIERVDRGMSPAIARAVEVEQAIARSRPGSGEPTGGERSNGAAGVTPTTANGVHGLAAPLPPAAAPGPLATALPEPAAASAGTAAEDSAQVTGPPVGRALGALVQARGGTMTMRLDPPHLGDLRITMRFGPGTVVAELLTSTVQAHDALTADLASLRSALERQGLVVERLTVQTTAPAARNEPSGQPSASGAPAANPAPSSTANHSGANDRSADRQPGQQHDAGGGMSRGRDGQGRSPDERGGGRRNASSFSSTFSSAFAAGIDD